ncbi:hypothetical protein [Streptomyces sp. AC550_RSS872]|uniref:hypothetical protein n=1 Tax=Streptomyces sp. AC550_RSS872 TaxID=2823689 RepID=UPI001C268E6A|nr:hypothetical protein [Streptomyces sp. AC550_RSS872]
MTLCSTVGTTRGVRDPALIRSPDGSKYYAFQLNLETITNVAGRSDATLRVTD